MEKASFSDLPKTQKRSNCFNKTRGIYIFAIFLAFLCFPFSIAYGADGQEAQNKKEISNDTDSWDLFFSLGLDRKANEIISRPDTVLRHRGVTVDSGLLEKAVQGQVNYILLNLFDDAKLGGIVDRTIIRSASSYSIIGHIDEESSGSFILTVNENVVVGNIRTSDRKHYQVMYSKAHVHEIRQIDDSQFPPCALGSQGSVRAPETGNVIPAYSADIAAYDNGDTFDVMVVYTQAARTAAGGTTAMKALINLAVDETNIVYGNSLITPRVNLVHQAEVSYDESAGFSTALNRLTNTSDGYMDNVHSLRDTYGADLVSLFIDNSSSCGLAWLMRNLSPSFKSDAFSIVHWNCATGNYSFSHEMGHNMGCAHALPESYQGKGLYNYSMGWRFGPLSDPDRYRSVMAYSPGIRINHFSNPDVTHAGYATGVPLGLSNEAHNALSINNAAYTVANWRQSVFAADINGDNDINYKDFSLFAIEWLNSGCVAPDWCNGADITKNGDVGIADLLEIALDWTLNY